MGGMNSDASLTGRQALMKKATGAAARENIIAMGEEEAAKRRKSRGGGSKEKNVQNAKISGSSTTLGSAERLG